MSLQFSEWHYECNLYWITAGMRFIDDFFTKTDIYKYNYDKFEKEFGVGPVQI